MSLGLENYKINAIGNIDNLSDDIVATSGFNEFCKEPYNIKEYSLYGYVQKNFIQKVVSLMRCILIRINPKYKE